MSFARVLRDATATSHADAAASGYMAALVAQHWFMYVELEAAAALMRSDPVAGPFVADELTRVPHLEADLRFLLGDGWRDAIAPTDANVRYCRRLREVATTWPGGFVAHHYTRYLGDLSGGQYVGAAVERAYGLESGDGVRFYRFDELADPSAFKDEYRARLDAASWDADEQDRVIDEVLLAYRCNTEVLHDLDRTWTPGKAA